MEKQKNAKKKSPHYCDYDQHKITTYYCDYDQHKITTYYCDYDQHKIGQSSSNSRRDHNDDEKTMPKSTSHSTITVFTAKIT